MMGGVTGAAGEYRSGRVRAEAGSGERPTVHVKRHGGLYARAPGGVGGAVPNSSSRRSRRARLHVRCRGRGGSVARCPRIVASADGRLRRWPRGHGAAGRLVCSCSRLPAQAPPFFHSWGGRRRAVTDTADPSDGRPAVDRHRLSDKGSRRQWRRRRWWRWRAVAGCALHRRRPSGHARRQLSSISLFSS